jgi:2-oxoglutarate dehydrogenase E2 component (dihydrolipoamide succinyltransferase)
MQVVIKIPTMGESIVEATIGKVLKPSGSSVRADEEIVEIETDKVNQVLSAPAAGVVTFSVKSGDVVKVGQTIGFIETTGAAAAPESVKEQVKKTVDEAVRELAVPPAIEPKPREMGRETRKKMTKLRRVIAERLVEVKNRTALLTTFNEVDMSAVMSVREGAQKNFQEKYGVKLGFMSFFIKACAAALQEFPDINARIDGDEIVYQHYFDIGVAVSTEKGLMVPVIRGADHLTHAEIEKKLKDFAERARAGTISIDDMQGGTFTITNGGVFGSLLSTPILNPPQSGILGMHNIVRRPVAVGEEIVIRPMMYLALSYDHRIVDGKESIQFLVSVKKSLEDAAKLQVDLYTNYH